MDRIEAINRVLLAVILWGLTPLVVLFVLAHVSARIVCKRSGHYWGPEEHPKLGGLRMRCLRCRVWAE